MGLKPVLYWTLDEAADAGLLPAPSYYQPPKNRCARQSPGIIRPARAGIRAPGSTRGDWAMRSSGPGTLAGLHSSPYCPTNLFPGPQPVDCGAGGRTERPAWRRGLAEIDRKDAGSKGATGGPRFGKRPMEPSRGSRRGGIGVGTSRHTGGEDGGGHPDWADGIPGDRAGRVR